ncbi:MAG: hypothetical protein NTU53_06555 [Planctomycetota bacterium]|nr:hypothetical protein [Planctomycetota bacterium]
MKTRFGKVPFNKLTDEEKEAVYQECERIRPEDGEPLNEEDLRLHDRAGIRPGRPRIGLGAKRINISMEQRLLKKADRFARKHKITRAKLIAESVKAYIAGAA